MSDFKNIIAKEFHNFVRLERDIFFEKHDDINWLPKYQADDAKLCVLLLLEKIINRVV